VQCSCSAWRGCWPAAPVMVALARGFSQRGIDVVTSTSRTCANAAGFPIAPPVLEQAFRDVVDVAPVEPRGQALHRRKVDGGRMATHLRCRSTRRLGGIVRLWLSVAPSRQARATSHQSSARHHGARTPSCRDERDDSAHRRRCACDDTMVAPVTMHIVHGGDHSLTVRGRRREAVLDEVLDVATAWIGCGLSMAWNKLGWTKCSPAPIGLGR